MNPVESRSSLVSVVRTSPEDVIRDVRKAMELADWQRFITRGAEVSLKVNLGWDKLIPGAVSAPWVVEGVIQTIRDYVGRIYLVESSQVVVDVEDALLMTRLDRVCGKYGVEWVNMSHSDFVRVRDDKRLVLKDVLIPEILTRTEVITLPLMKTHNKSTITGAVKNQWGCLRELRHNYHLVLSRALVDVNAIVKPRFAVMDGTIGLEGNGPKSGAPKEMNLLLASGDIVALDVTAARIMGFELPCGVADVDRATEEVLRAIESVHSGEPFFSEDIARAALQEFVKSGGKKEPFAQLTTREREVLVLIAEGKSNKEIAMQLDIGVRTIETHRERIMRRLGIHSVAGLTKFAIANGLISLESGPEGKSTAARSP